MPAKARASRKNGLTFLRSLNVERDCENRDVLSQYIVTSNTIRAIQRIASCIRAGEGGAWTLTGPFGTGKSAFCVFLAHLLSPARNRLSRLAVDDFCKSAPQLASALFPSPAHRIGLVPAAVSGSAEPIAAAVVRAVCDATARFSIPVPRSIAVQLKGLSSQMAREAVIPSQRVLALLEELLASSIWSSNRDRGLLLIIDELGKLLEHAAANPDESDVFLLQQLAELSSRSKGRLLLVGVLHQDFRGYASALPPVERAEWEKIRGRFEDTAFEEPPSQLLRFVALTWQRIVELEGGGPLSASQKAVQSLASFLWERELAPPGLDQREGMQLLASAAPLHPLAAVLIGPLFRRVGQNERSAFSFLASEEPFSLRSAIRASKHPKELFDVVDLYQYLVSSLGNSLLHTPDARRWAEAFELEARHPALGTNSVSVLRAVALLSIAARWYNLRPSRDLLAYALGGRLSKEQLEEAMAELTKASIIVHRRYNDTYALWEGSDVDVEAKLRDGRERIDKVSSIASLLRKHHPVRPLLARRHSFEKGTLRFFQVEFYQGDQLNAQQLQEPSGSDGRIVVILPPRRGRPQALESLKAFGPRTLVRVLPQHDRLAELAAEAGAIDWVNRNTPELSGDPTARRELATRRIDVERSLTHLMDLMLTSSSRASGTWYYLGRELTICNGRQLHEMLSKICDRVFRAAPPIDNEIINRQELSSAAAAARRILIERMIDAVDQPELGLAGNPPERSIYRSVLSVEGGLGLHRCLHGEWGFYPPGESSEAHDLYEAIDGFFAQAEQAPRPVADLFEQLRQPPFGLRDGPIPVLVCAVLLARESDVALYEAGAFRPSLTPALFERLVKSPEVFAVRRLCVSGLRARVFHELERLVGQPISRKANRQQLLKVARPLLRFVASLPEFAKTTSELSSTGLAIRKAFLEATEPETLLFDDLPKACGLEPFKPTQRGRLLEVSQYVGQLKNVLSELRGAYPALLTSVRHLVADVFGMGEDVLHDLLPKRAQLLAGFTLDRDLKMFVERICAPDPDPDRWLDGVASLIAERPTEKWRNDDLARFIVRLQQFVRRFTLLEATLADRPGLHSLDQCESIRVALTGTHFGQRDQAIHLDAKQAARAARLQESIEQAIRSNADSSVSIAALCRVLQQLLDAPIATEKKVS